MDGITYESYEQKDLIEYLTKECKDLKEMPGYIHFSLMRYKDTLVVLKKIDSAVSIQYDKKDKEKVQKIIDLIEKWDYCGAKPKAFCIEYETTPSKLRFWPRFYEFDSVVLVCSGYFDKEFYIKKYTDGTNFKVTDL